MTSKQYEEIKKLREDYWKLSKEIDETIKRAMDEVKNRKAFDLKDLEEHVKHMDLTNIPRN